MANNFFQSNLEVKWLAEFAFKEECCTTNRDQHDALTHLDTVSFPCIMAAVMKVEDLLAQLAAIDPASLEKNPAQTMEVLKLSKQLTTTLEAPIDRAVDYIFKVSWCSHHTFSSNDNNIHTAILVRSTSIGSRTQPFRAHLRKQLSSLIRRTSQTLWRRRDPHLCATSQPFP